MLVGRANLSQLLTLSRIRPLVSTQCSSCECYKILTSYLKNLNITLRACFFSCVFFRYKDRLGCVEKFSTEERRQLSNQSDSLILSDQFINYLVSILFSGFGLFRL